jgi:Zn-dependent protease
MTGWWVLNWYEAGGAVVVVSWAFWVIFSIVMHELSHGWAALWQGDDTPRRLGHMTSNPLVHMGPMSLIMFFAIGIAWGLMPVDPSRFRWKRRGRIVVAGAGPAMNIALAILVLFLLLPLWMRFAFGHVDEPLFSNVVTFLWFGGFLNIALAMFNLLPIPPLDGSGILAGAWMKWYIWMQNPQFVTIGFFIFLVVFLSGIGGVFFDVAIEIAGAIFDAGSWVFGGPRVFDFGT